MSVPDADTLIRLAEILEVYVSELLGTKIENENVASDVAEQLSRINEQLAIKNRRSRRIWKIVAIILAVIVLVNIFIAVFFSVPDRFELEEEIMLRNGFWEDEEEEDVDEECEEDSFWEERRKSPLRTD